MDREQVLLDFRAWVDSNPNGNGRLYAYQIFEKLDELEEEYE